MVRPRMAPWNSAPTLAFASAGAIQLLFGPASSFSLRAHERQVLGPRHVARVAAVQVTARVLVLVQREQGATGQHLFDEALVLGLGAIAPHDTIGCGDGGNLINPLLEWCWHGRLSLPIPKKRTAAQRQKGTVRRFHERAARRPGVADQRRTRRRGYARRMSTETTRAATGALRRPAESRRMRPSFRPDGGAVHVCDRLPLGTSRRAR